LEKGEGLSKADLEILKTQDIEIREVVQCVRKLFLKIACSFSPHKAPSIRQAEIAEIMKRCLTGCGGEAAISSVRTSDFAYSC